MRALAFRESVDVGAAVCEALPVYGARSLGCSTGSAQRY
jgi:hypothetical protein